jgi:guanylate kinase
MAKRNLFLLVGPSGSGKSTLEKNLLELAPEEFYKAISATTRPMRKGEVEGIDYFFYQKEGEDRGLPVFNEEEMLESVEFAGNKYGLPLDQIHENKDTIVVVEPNGVIQIKEYVEEHNFDINLYVIYLDIDLNTRVKNMVNARGDDPEAVKERLEADKIPEDFNRLGLEADLTIKKLNPNLHFHVYEWIQLNKKLYS